MFYYRGTTASLALKEGALTCPKGHPWDASQVTIGWVPCGCRAGSSDLGAVHEHLVIHCSQAGCDATWHASTDLLIDAIKGRDHRPSAELGASQLRDPAHAIAALDTAWTLLTHAREFYLVLLQSSHPSAARIAEIRTWIQSCVKAIDNAQRLKELMSSGDEAAHVEEVATELAAVVDSFHMYASMLQQFHSQREAAPGAAAESRSLAVAADDERVLLTCRAALRRSLQQLIGAI